MPIKFAMLYVSIAGIVLTLLICRTLANAHPAKWQELGGDLRHIFNWRGSGRFSRFVFSKEAKALDDRTLWLEVCGLRVTYLAVTGLLLFVLFRA